MESIFFVNMSFCLETKGPKIQDLEPSAKNEICSLKTLNSCGSYSVLRILILSRTQTGEFF
ncbi:hypothetical protein QF044_002289 [Chryseobacterium sp. W4I1]|nr:hypothetical protein [Chryseobacterium sp. W4I1]